MPDVVYLRDIVDVEALNTAIDAGLVRPSSQDLGARKSNSVVASLFLGQFWIQTRSL
jgi:hypothetical protein